MQITKQEIKQLLEEGAEITIRLAGVTFPSLNGEKNRQRIIEEMCNKNSREVNLISEEDNEYDEFAIRVDNEDGIDIGFIPKKKNFTVKLQKQRRPISIATDTLEPCVNEAVHKKTTGLDYAGKIVRFNSYRNPDTGKKGWGVTVAFWKA